MYTVVCRRVLTNTLLYLIGSKPLVAFGNETYKPNLKNYNYKYNNYTRNLVGRSLGRCLSTRLLSGSSMRFTIRSFGCALRRALISEQSLRISSLIVGIWRSLRITVFGTYQGASASMCKAFDWKRSRISTLGMERIDARQKNFWSRLFLCSRYLIKGKYAISSFQNVEYVVTWFAYLKTGRNSQNYSHCFNVARVK
jgi:hypothetical protein